MVPVPSTIVDRDSPLEPIGLTADDPLGGLARWLAEARVDAEIDARARRRWLRRQAGEEANLAGVLLDFAERGGPVGLRTAGGSIVRGPVVALGADFVVVRQTRPGDVIIPLSKVVTVRGGPDDHAPVGDRHVVPGVVLGEVLVEMAADQPLVLVSAGDDECRGRLHHAGSDVFAVATANPDRDLVYIATAALDRLVVLER